MTDLEDPKFARALLPWAKTVDKLHDRYFANPRPLVDGSRILADDEVLRPYYMSHEVSQRLAVAVDCLHSVRTLSVPADLTSGQFDREQLSPRAYSAFPPLRAALENACVVAWLLDPEDQLDRVTRRVHLWARSHDSRNDVEKIMVANHPGDRRKPTKLTGWTRDRDFIERMREFGVPNMTDVVRDPKRNTLKTTRIVDAGALSLGKGGKPYKPWHYSVCWRGFSGASHGDLWALMSLPNRDILSEPDRASDRVQTRVYLSPETFALWSDVATTAVKRAIDMYDRSRQVLTDHCP